MTKKVTEKSKIRLTRRGLIGASLSLMTRRELIEAAGIVMLMMLGGLFEFGGCRPRVSISVRDP